MSQFTQHDGAIIADPQGEMSYQEAISTVIDEAVASIEEALWNLVDDVEYIVEENLDEEDDDDLQDEPTVE